MATTKIWPIRDSLKRVLDYAENPDKTGYLGLRQVLEYAEDANKTGEDDEFETCYHITGINCMVKTAFEEMTAVKERFGKTGGNQAYHAYQSFKPGEVTPEQCHEIGVTLAKTLWGDRFQIIVTTHLDKSHLHNHLVINSVSFKDGKKFNDNKATYAEMRRISDSFCRNAGLSVIENPGGKTPRAIYFAEKRGEPTRYNLMREAIDRAMERNCINLQDLQRAMLEQGNILEASETRKYATLRSVSSKKPVRLYQLGEKYDLPKLQERLEENRDWFHFDRSYPRYRPNPKPPRPRVYHMRSSFFSAKKVGGLRGLYWHWCYLLGIFPKGNRRKPLSPEMRQEVRKLEQYTREFDLMHRYQLYSVEKVQAFVADRDRELAQLTDERDRYSNQLRYLTLPEEASAMKALRKELSTARAILAGVQEKQRLISNEQQMMRPPAQVTREKGVRRNEER